MPHTAPYLDTCRTSNAASLKRGRGTIATDVNWFAQQVVESFLGCCKDGSKTGRSILEFMDLYVAETSFGEMAPTTEHSYAVFLKALRAVYIQLAT